MTRTDRRDLLKGLAWVSPWLVGFSLFTVLPIGLSVYYSLCDYPLLQRPVFTGTENYRGLAVDPVFWQTIGNTAVLRGRGAAGRRWSLALALALLLNVRVPGQSVYRTLVFLPSLVPAVASAMLWLWLYNTRLGLINLVLTKLGISDPPGWLTDDDLDQAGADPDVAVGCGEHGGDLPGRAAGRAPGAVRGGRAGRCRARSGSCSTSRCRSCRR